MTNNPSLSDIRARRKAIATAKAELDAEDKDLADLEDALERYAKRYRAVSSAAEQYDFDVYPAMRHISKFVAETVDKAKEKRLSNEKAILEALERGPLWTTAVVIREIASQLKGADLPMSSVSPCLTDLKNRGKVKRDGMKIALTERLQKEADTNQAAE